MAELLYKEESFHIRGAAFDVYQQFRNRHKEIVYKRAMIHGIKARGLSAQEEYRIPILFDGSVVGTYIPDLVVAQKIFIELKSKPFLHHDDILQFWHYLKSSDFKVGYLINFGAKNGVQIIRRIYDKARKSSASVLR